MSTQNHIHKNIDQPKLADLATNQRVKGIYRIEFFKTLDNKTYSLIKLRDGSGNLMCLVNNDLLPENLDRWHAVEIDLRIFWHKIHGLTGSIQTIKVIETIPSELVLDLLPVATSQKELRKHVHDFVSGLSPLFRQFVLDILSDDETARSFCRNPASRTYHHCDRGGLLRHALEAQAFIRKSSVQEIEQYQIAKVAAFLHDIGKVLTLNKWGFKTDTGKWVRHEMLIQQICAAALKNLKRTCSAIADQLLHIWTAAYPGQYGIQPQTTLVGIVRQADRQSVKLYQRCRNLRPSCFEVGLYGASR